MTLGGGDCFFQCAIICRALHWRYDTYFQVTAELAVTMQVTGVGGYDAYFQVAAGLAVTTLIPRSATEIGATYFQVATRGLAVTLATEIGATLISRSLWAWRLRHLFPGLQQRLEVTTLIPRSATEIYGPQQVTTSMCRSLLGSGGGGRKVAMRTLVACSALLRRGNGGERVLKTKF